MTETWDNGKKTHGPKPFETQQGEGGRNLYWKIDYNLEQTSAGRGYSRDAVRTWRKISYRMIRTGDLMRQTNGI
jgi:hypothetical protein